MLLLCKLYFYHCDFSNLVKDIIAGFLSRLGSLIFIFGNDSRVPNLHPKRFKHSHSNSNKIDF